LVQKRTASWNAQLGEFILPYEDMRTSTSPEKMLMDFFKSTYEVSANLGKWDRKNLDWDLN
jgi:Family of unknown function (DUF5996)